MSLKVKDISFSYQKDKEILSGISFEIERCKTLGIVGVSGTGKSTLLKLIAGLLQPSEINSLQGEIYFEDKPIHELKKNGKLSFMFQDSTLMPNLNVFGNITLPFKILNTQIPKNIDGTIESVGLKDFKLNYPNELSGGMKTRVALARSFITNPELLLLDEPFSSLDIGWKYKLYNELEELQKINNTTVLIVSHDLEEVLEISDKVIVLGRSGDIILEMTPATKSFSMQDIKNLKTFIIENHN